MKQLSFTILLIFLFRSICFPVNEDSLVQVIKNPVNPEEKIKAFFSLATLYKSKDKKQAFAFAEEAKKISQKINSSKHLALSEEQFGLIHQAASEYEKALDYFRLSLDLFRKNADSSGVANALNNIGLMFYYLADYPTAKKYFEQSAILKVSNNDSIGAGRAFNNTGIMLDIMGEPSKAIESYLKALAIYEKMKRKDMMAGTMQNIGLIHINQKKFDEALDYYEKSNAIATEINDEYMLSKGFNSLGIIYDNKGKYDKALEYYQSALEFSEKINDKPGIAQAYNNIAINMNYHDNFEKALEYYLKALKIKEEIGNRSSIAVTQLGIGEVYKKMGKTGIALEFFHKGLESASATGYKEYIRKAYEGLAYTYSKQKDFVKAFDYLDRLASLKDSLLNDENNRVLEELKAKYESEKKENEIQLLNKENLLQESELGKSLEAQKRKNYQMGALALGLFLFIALFFMIYRTNVHRKKANDSLTKKNFEITFQKQTIEEKNKSIVESITYAKRLQDAILPPSRFIKECIPQSFILYKPKDIVSGDFYWLEKTGDELFFAAVDCTGHGVPGAMVSVIAHNGLNRCVKEFGLRSPAKILDKLNELLEQTFERSENDIKDGMDIALCKLIKQNGQWQLEYAGANNPMWLVNSFGPEKDLKQISADKQPIGKFQNRKPFTNHNFILNEEDTIYIFSDGYADQFGGPKGKKFKYNQFKEVILSLQSQPMEQQKNILEKTIEEWRGNLVQIDDICVIGIRV